jgi:hypothetical protein
MKLMALALTAVVASSASAGIVAGDLFVSRVSQTDAGNALDVYTVFVEFNGGTDRITNVGGFKLVAGSGGSLTQFYHKDNIAGGVGGFNYGAGEATWNPSTLAVSAAQRPFDSFVTIGTTATGGTNNVTADAGWPGSDYDRGDIPTSTTGPGWFLGGGSNLGQVGVGGNTNFRVRIGQFAIAAGSNGGRWDIRVSWNNGAGGPSTTETRSFNLAIPAPGAFALLGLAGLAGRRRR